MNLDHSPNDFDLPPGNSTIRTISGRYIDVLDPLGGPIFLPDIAHALAHINRFGGHTTAPYSVAEHSLTVSRIPLGGALRQMRSFDRWSVHRLPLTVAHRITSVRPNTVTLVIRGPKSRVWGFYPPEGFVDQHRYDYATRRPVHEER